MLLMATVAIGTAATVAAGSSSSSLRKTTNAVVIPPVYDNNSLKVVSNNDSRETTLTMTTSHHSHHHGGSSSNPNDNKNNSNNKVGEFDFYVFSMSYQPEFCHESMKEQYTGCMTYNKSWEGQLTIHGLWPNVSVHDKFIYYYVIPLVFVYIVLGGVVWLPTPPSSQSYWLAFIIINIIPCRAY